MYRYVFIYYYYYNYKQLLVFIFTIINHLFKNNIIKRMNK